MRTKTIYGFVAALLLVIVGLLITNEWNAQHLIALSSADVRRAQYISRAAFLALALVTIGVAAIMTRLLVRDASRRGAQIVQAATEQGYLETVVRERTTDLSTLATYLQQNGEQEKADLGHNLHAVMGDLLTAARMDLAWLRARNSNQGSEFIEKLQGLDGLLTEAVELERGVVEALRPGLIDHFGLPTALQACFEESCRKANLQCTVSIGSNVPILSIQVGITLYRVAQEALANIIRHAGAHTVILSIDADVSGYEVVVKDDGRGVNVHNSSVHGTHGISGMQHRILGLGGKFYFSSVVGRGTTVRFSVPLTR